MPVGTLGRHLRRASFGIAVVSALSAAPARADPGSDEANRQRMMSDMRASAAANDRANFDSQQRLNQSNARNSGSMTSGSSGSASSSGSGSSGGYGGSGGQGVSNGPRSVVATYNFIVHRQESPSALVARLQAEAAGGNGLSAYNLGRIYYTGFDAAPKSDTQARRWFGEGAKLGHPGAQAQIAYMLNEGLGGPADEAGALSWAEKAAAQGDTYGEALWGSYALLAHAKDSKLDLSGPVAALIRAADKGQTVAQSALGIMVFHDGVGAPIDRVKAAHYLRLAAEQNEPHCQAELGRLYLEGIGVAQDDAAAVAWTRKAVAQNNSDALDTLGTMNLLGRGVPRDAAEGARLIKAAADAGNVHAMGTYGVLAQQGTGVAKDEGLGAQYLKRAADRHDGDAEQNYAIAFFNGQGVAKDDATGVYWQKRAADDGNTGAAATYCVRLRTGQGVAKNAVEALRYGRAAAQGGSARGQACLGFLYLDGEGTSKDLGQALANLRKAAAQGDTDAAEALKSPALVALASSGSY